MGKVKLKDFITLADGRCYCIMKQMEIGNNHFACALTVPEEMNQIKNADCVLLKSVILANGQIGTREYLRTEEDYQKIMEDIYYNGE